MAPTDQQLSFRYKFTQASGKAHEFLIELDGERLALKLPARQSYPNWAKLSYQQCPNCPLKETASPNCPVAVSLIDLIDAFKESFSYEKVEVEIVTEARKYVKQTTLANGISSLIGIYMVTSGCPILDKLKPMVRTHLPFATWQETLYRAIGTYLLAQYFLYRRGGKPDWDMEHLTKIYEDVRIVNKSFCQRLWETCIQDATLNAVVQLDCFADMTSGLLQRKRLDELEKLFHAYFTDPT